MKKYFEEMLKQVKPVTQDDINRMKQGIIDKTRSRDIDNFGDIKPNSSFGTIIEIGDIVLYFLESKTMHVKTVLLRELDKLNSYKFDRMDKITPVLIP
jgi:hypothetical protein